MSQITPVKKQPLTARYYDDEFAIVGELADKECTDTADFTGVKAINSQSFIKPRLKPIPFTDIEDLGPHIMWSRLPKTWSRTCRKGKKILFVPSNSESQIVATAEMAYSQALFSKRLVVYPTTPWSLQYSESSDISIAVSKAELESYLASIYTTLQPAFQEVKSLAFKAKAISLLILVIALVIGGVLTVTVNFIVGLCTCAVGGGLNYLCNTLLILALRHKAAKNYRELIRLLTESRDPLYAKGVRPRPGYNCCYILFEASYYLS